MSWPNATTYPDRATWLDARRAGLGASDVPKVLGLSPYGGPWSVWASKKLATWSTPDNAAMRRGRGLEAGVLDWWVQELHANGTQVSAAPTALTHVMGPAPLLVTPDAEVFGLRGQKHAGAEVKTDTTRFRWGPTGTTIHRWTREAAELVREDYAAQCYACIAATGAPFWVLIVATSLSDLRWYVLLSDKRIEDAIVQRCQRWWATHIEGGTPPDVDDTDACRRAMAAMFPPRERKRERPATPDEVWLAQCHQQATRQRQVAETTRNHAAARLLASIGTTGHDTVTFPGGRATRVHRGGSVSVRVTTK